MTTAVETSPGPVATGPRDPHDRAGRRLRSLDLLRGVTVAGMITVNATAGVQSLDKPVFATLLHADWAGFTLADTVFPAFLTMVGVSIAVSARGDAGGVAATRRVLARAVRLILIGLLLGHMFFLADFHKYGVRLPGVLQRIGIVFAICALLYPRMGMRARAIAAGGLLIGYWMLCLLPVPGGGATDLWVPGHNFVSWVDRIVFGEWRYVKGAFGYDPEGLLGTLPAVAQALLGTLAGDVLRRGLPVMRTAKTLLIAGLAGIVTGLAWGVVFPIAKNLWTSSFVLLSTGLTIMLLGLFHYWFDRDDRPARKGDLFGSFGRNAIAAYVLHEVASIILTGDAIQLPFKWLAPVTGTQIAALAPVALFVAIVWYPIAYMDKRGWYLRV
ncbi:acyltransferase family protein [uncultured Sphingomonas sp.]|uniref:acyltransferase family protein n=1 Tax=uncultured Sphingomonas sp. TaxID=158754 RepID=UPI0025E2B0AA|nr:heparan-alpha-glucosaminide N-acetyltransferase domain-containing protein [uncultured Sphingomonas sp.]